jgi:hypothetical protein
VLKCCKIRIIIFLIHAAILKMFISRHCFIVHSTCYSACVWNIINIVDSLCLCHTENGIINLNILQPVFCKCSHFYFCCIICLHKALFMNQPGFFASICFHRSIVLTCTYVSRNKSFPITVLQWRTEGVGGVGFKPPPEVPKFYKVEPDCKLSQKYLVFLFQHPN